MTARLDWYGCATFRLTVGSLVIGVKKMLRKLLTPILQRQVAYNAANARATGGPGLDFDYNFTLKFLGYRHRLISGESRASTRNFESISGENRFALILVKSCHG